MKSLNRAVLQRNRLPSAQDVRIDVASSHRANEFESKEEVRQHYDHISQATLQILIHA